MKQAEKSPFPLQSDLDNLEQERQVRFAEKNKSNTYFALMLLIFFAIVITGSVLEIHKAILLAFTGGFATLGFKGISSFYAQAMAKFTLYYKENFIAKLVKNLYPKTDYYPEEKGAAPIMAKALNTTAVMLKSTQDLVEGVAENGWKFSFSELHREKRQEHAFANLLYEIKLPHNFSQKLYFTPHEDKTNPIKNPFKKNIELQDTRGNKFTIKTNTPDFAKEILTKEILAIFAKLKKNFSTKNHIEFSLIEDSFYIIVPTIKDYLNISIISPVSNTTVQRLTKEIHTLLLPIQLLTPLLEKSIKNLTANKLAEIDKIEIKTAIKKPIELDKDTDSNEL